MNMKEKLQNLNNMDENEIRQIILETISMTQSWMNLEDLKRILPQEQYEEISEKLSQRISENYPNLSGEKLETLRKEEMADEEFFIIKKEDGSYALRRFDFEEMANKENFAEINLDQVDITTLEETAFDVMKKHRDYGRFHNNGILTASEIKEILTIATNELFQKVSLNKMNNLKSGLQNLNNMNETEIRQIVLETMSMTQSWMNLEDLKRILPQEQYEEISEKLSQKIIENYPGLSGEKLETLRKEEMSDEEFFIIKKEDGSYALRRFDFEEMANKENFAEINLDQVDITTLKATAFDAMKKHRDYDVFHSNGILTADNIKEVLDLTIESLNNKKEISIKQVIKNAITNGITLEDVAKANNYEIEDEKNVNEVSKDD